MAQYLLIESRDPFESNDVGYYYDLARGLAEGDNQVTLFLVQNGVLAARQSAHSAKLEALARSGVTVLADDFSLQERGIAKLAEGVAAAAIDVVVDHLWRLGENSLTAETRRQQEVFRLVRAARTNNVRGDVSPSESSELTITPA